MAWAKSASGFTFNLNQQPSLQVTGSGSTWHVATAAGVAFTETYATQADAQAVLDAFTKEQGEVTL